MLFLRFAGKALLFLAFIALAYDGARSLATPSQGIAFSSFASLMKTYSPQSWEWLQAVLAGNIPGFLWTRLLEPMLVLPVSILFTFFGTLLFLGGYRRPPPEIVRE